MEQMVNTNVHDNERVGCELLQNIKNTATRNLYIERYHLRISLALEELSYKWVCFIWWAVGLKQWFGSRGSPLCRAL